MSDHRNVLTRIRDSQTRRGGDLLPSVPLQRVSADFLATDQPVEDRDGASARSVVTVPTRQLCKLVYVHEQLRNDIRDHYPAHSRRAWAPSYAVDLIALLRHTARADRIALTRAGLVTAVVIGVGIGIATECFAGGGRGYLAALAVILLAAATRMILRRTDTSIQHVGRRLYRYAQRHTQTFMLRSALGILGVTALAIRAAQVRPVRDFFLITGVGLIATWLVTCCSQIYAYLVARRVMTAKDDLRNAARPVSRLLEQRARSVVNSNVLVYAHDRAREPLGLFIGAGHPLVRWTTPPVALTKALNDEENIREIDIRDLHCVLATAAQDLKLPTLKCHHRLYVDGLSIDPTGALMSRQPPYAPVTEVTDDVILDAVDGPTTFIRGYLCIQATTPDGSVVVTMLVHAIREHDLLQLDINVHALPEVVWPPVSDPSDIDSDRSDYDGAVPPVPKFWTHAIVRGFQYGTMTYGRTLFASIPQFCRSATRPALARARVKLENRQIANDSFDLGAEDSLREHLALEQPMHRNAFVDMMAQSSRLQFRLIRAVAEYLSDHNINPGDFAAQATAIITNNQQTVFNNLTAGAVAFGNNSAVSGTVTMGTSAANPAGAGVST